MSQDLNESSDESSAEREGKSQAKDYGSCSLVDECPENFMLPGMLAILLFGLLKENINDGRTIDFLTIDKDPIKKRHYHAMMPKREKLMKKLLIVKGFQVVASSPSSKPP